MECGRERNTNMHNGRRRRSDGHSLGGGLSDEERDRGQSGRGASSRFRHGDRGTKPAEGTGAEGPLWTVFNVDDAITVVEVQ